MNLKILKEKAQLQLVLRKKTKMFLITLEPAREDNTDNNRKHLENNLSVAKLLLQESKEDSRFSKELTKAMQKSTACSSSSMKTVSKLMV